MTALETETLPDFADTDFCDPRVFDDPYELYRWLRDQDSLHYDAKNDLYIAARHEDVFHISREAETYCNKFGVRPKIAGDMSIIVLDGEEHTRTRRGVKPLLIRRRWRRCSSPSSTMIDMSPATFGRTPNLLQ